MTSFDEKESPVPRVLLPDDSKVGFNQVQFNDPIEVKQKPSFGETLSSNFKLFNDIVNLPTIVNSAYYTPPADPDYSPIESGLLNRVREEDWPRVLSTSSYYEGNAVVKKINQEYYDKDIRDRSGWFANLTTTLGAAFFSPTTLIPISQTMKYATVGAGAFKNAVKMTQSLVPAVALQNAVLVGAKETEDYRDWIHDTMIESFIAAGIGGALGAFAAKGTQKSFKKVEAAFDSVRDDVGVKYLLGKDGEVIGAEAYALPGSGVGAERVKDINSMIQAVNPFEKNPYTKAFFGWAQPIMKGLTNRFNAVRNLTDDLFAHNFEVAGGDITKIKGPSAENLKRSWNTKVESVSLQQKDDWLEHIGAKGLFENAKAAVGEWTGKFISEKEYNELVGKAIRRDGKTGVATVDRSARRWIDEIYDPLLDELKKRRPDIAEHEYTNIRRYLNRMPDKDKLQQDPFGFLKEYESHLGDVSQRIWREQKPLDTINLRNKAIRKRIKFLDEHIKPSSEFLPHPDRPSLAALKNERRLLKAELNQNIRSKRALQENLDKRIVSGEIDLEMLADRPTFTPEQLEQIEKLKAPITKAESEFNSALKEYRGFEGRKLTKAEQKLKAEKASVVEQKRQALRDAEESIKAKKKSEEVNAFVNKARRELDIALEEYRKFKAKRIGKYKKSSGPNLTEEARIRVKKKREALAKAKEQLHETLRSKEFNAPISKAEEELATAIKDYERLGKLRRTEEQQALKNKAREEVKKKREAYRKEKQKLQAILRNEELDPNIWWKRISGEDVIYGLRNPKRAKLGRVLTNDEIKVKAQRTLDTYLQQNEEQTLGQLFESIAERGTSVLRERTVLWNDAKAEKWLINDIDILGRAYVNQMVPRIHLDDVFLQHGKTPKEGQEVIASQMKQQYDAERYTLLSKEQTPEIQKQIKKLDKDYKDAKEFVNKMYKTFLGDLVDRSATSYRITNAIKEMGAASLLGNLPILQLTEFFTPLFKYTFSEYIQDGLFPMLRYWNELKRSGKVDRAAFQDCGVGLNVALGKRIQSIMGYGAQSQPKTVLERYIQNMVGLSHNFSLANYITDFQETMVAFMAQAKTVRLLEKFERGEALTAKEIGYLDVVRINPEKHAKQILQQVRKHGDKVEGGFVANWHLWDKEAFDAQQVFRSGIEKETRSIITKPNALDVPFSFKENQIISLATQFLSFPFAATLNFTVPILTKPDAQKFIGLLTTMAAAAMVDPLRQLAKGEEVELDFEKLATSAFVNSGFYGWQLDAAQRLNAAVDLPFLRPFQGDRFRRKDPWALLGGPAAGILSNLAGMFSGAVNGELTQGDLRNAVRYATPFLYNWYLAQPINAMIEATGAPEKRSPRD